MEISRFGLSLLLVAASFASIRAQSCRGYFFINCDDEDNLLGDCEYVAHWVVRGDDIDFSVTAETTGWVAIGFSPDRFMPNTDVVLGAADAQGSFVTDRFADVRAQPPIDANQDISNAMASHENGFTSISFTRPRDSGDDRDFSLDQCRHFLFAWSGSVNTVTMNAGWHGPINRMPSNETICLPSAAECPAVIVNCSTTQTGNIVTASCVTGPGVTITSTTCRFEEAAPFRDCVLPFSFDVSTFVGGPQVLTIRITDDMERTEERELPFMGIAPGVAVNCRLDTATGGNPQVECFNLTTIVQVNCSYDGGPPEDCSLSFEIDLERFTPGTHTLVITFMNVLGETVTASPIIFVVTAPLIFTCSQNQVSESIINIDCNASNDLVSIKCGIDGTFENCTLPFSVNLTLLAVGDHRITIAVTDEFDQNARNTTIITVPEPSIVDCTGSFENNFAQIDCPGIDTVPDFTDIRCLIDGTLDVGCTFPFNINASSFSTGDHTVRVIARRMSTDERVSLGEAQFTIPPLDFTFINNTPRLSGDRVTAEFEGNRPNLDIMCQLTNLGVPRQDCSSGSFTQTNLLPGDYTLRVVARDIGRGERFIIRSRIRVRGDINFCTIHLINRQLTVTGNNATVEFGSSGVASEFTCVLDRRDIFPCQSPVQLTELESGLRHFKIIPTDCGRNFRPRVVKFFIN